VTGITTRRSVEELKALAAQGASDLAGKDHDADAIAAWAAEHFPGTLTVACSMADAVLPHIVAEHAPGVDVLFLDTGYHFSDTLVERQLVAETLDVNIVDVKPVLSVAEQDEAHGKDLFARDPAACCRMRKVEPLRQALGAYEGWVTGVRRDEGPSRANAPVVSWDEAFGLVKINPLVTWSLEDLLRYSNEHRLPVNLLVTNGYPSIGCEPCTQAVGDGDDARAGRWSGFAKTECGLHA
jgi:phosphoadenosine phosphosulfate reductase